MKMSVGIADTVTDIIQSLKDEAEARIKKSVGKALLKFWSDVLTEEPTPYVLTGYMRGSIAIYVGGRKIETPPPPEGLDAGAPDTIVSGPYEGWLVINAPYAHYLHEGVSHSGNAIVPGPRSAAAGAGPKFVEVKQARHGREYLQIIADELLKGGPNE